MYLYGIAKAFGQISPRNAGAITVQNRFYKQPIVFGGYADMAFAARQKVLYTLPLVVTKGIAAQAVSSESADLP
jgi:hypothetical protein